MPTAAARGFPTTVFTVSLKSRSLSRLEGSDATERIYDSVDSEDCDDNEGIDYCESSDYKVSVMLGITVKPVIEVKAVDAVMTVNRVMTEWSDQSLQYCFTVHYC